MKTRNTSVDNYVYDFLKDKRYIYKSNKLGNVIIRFNTDKWEDVECSCYGNVDELNSWHDKGSFYEEPQDFVEWDDTGYGYFDIDDLELSVTIPRYGIRNLKCFIYGLGVRFVFDVKNDDSYDGSFNAYKFIIDDVESQTDDVKLVINRKQVKANNRIKEYMSFIENDVIPNKIVKAIYEDFIENLMKAIENRVIDINWEFN